jgi:queuine tRNA-ribosyltransferase
MPVGTQATVKAMSPRSYTRSKPRFCFQIRIPVSAARHELVREAGGLHAFMGWDGPILTDRADFRYFSLGDLRKITDKRR